MDDLASQVWALLVLVVGVGAEWLRRKIVGARKLANERRATPRNLARQRVIRGRLGELAAELGGQRALLLQVSNGGRIPKPGSPMFITIADEWRSSSMPTVLGRYEARPLRDPFYEGLLLQVDAEGIVLLHTEDIPAASMLRDAYEAAGLASSWVFVVRYEPGVMFYVSVSSRLQLEDTPTARDIVRSYTNIFSHLLGKDLSRTDDVLDIGL